jgi:hypothetical protein
MHYDIRTRAKKMMSDLLFIAEKSNSRQKTAIFKTPETRNNLVIPLIKALHNSSAFLTPEDKEFGDIVGLMQDLERTETDYDIVKLFDTEHPDNKTYRQHKRQQVNQKLQEMGEVILVMSRDRTHERHQVDAACLGMTKGLRKTSCA